MSLELTGVHGLLKRHKLFTHKYIIIYKKIQIKKLKSADKKLCKEHDSHATR